ncbi:redoxin domain-containing protein [Nocardiopsis sp. FIRDI 009]|uniref:redoxin domain-containing protein n=1 Tax=Nocardiopsis sp. FIRDI 009 TaxID=714197 RepID=UPI000E288900|nr:redoxin domain-containing protein [Nocardiopsis sp. FIRDI 009]
MTITSPSERRLPALAAVVTAAVLGLTACAADPGEVADGSAEAPATRGPDGSGTDAAPAEVPDALAFDTRTVDGDDFSGSSLTGEPAVLWFWAPWCTVCRGEAAGVLDAADRHSGDVAFLGVAGLGEVDAMRGFVSDTGTGEMTHLVDEDGSIWSGFGVASQPAFAFLGADGSVETVQGTLTDDDLDARVEALTEGS